MDGLRWFLFRLRALLGRRRKTDALDEELQFHLDVEAARLVEAGMTPADAAAAARRDLGSPLVVRTRTRDVWTFPSVDQLLRDLAYGWRQITRAKVSSGAAILTLAVAVGACLTTFAVMDALLYRPLPIRNADRLHVLTRESHGPGAPTRSFDGVEYPLFQRMRAAVTGATLVGASYTTRADITFGGDQDIEKAYVQYVSGDFFAQFGLRPAAGRLLTQADDVVPGGHQVAVISEGYWTRRFARDPRALGRSLRFGPTTFEIVGVVAAPFTGIEPGLSVDVLLPTMMHPSVSELGSTWMRLLTLVHPGVSPASIRDQLQAQLTAYQLFRSPTFTGVTDALRQRLLTERARLDPAASGVSGLQERYRSGLGAVALLVGLVLLVACANVGNLMIARTAARSRELALRVSLGAGRRSVLQLVMAECAWIAVLAAILAVVFAAVAGPAVVGRVNVAEEPAWLALQLDIRAVAFGGALTMAVALLFGLAPALVAVRVTPAAALQGGHTPRSHRRLMLGLVLVQVAFCVLVVFVGGLLVATLDQLARQPLGFVPQHLLAVQGVAATPRPVEEWERAVAAIGELPGVDKAALGDRTLLDGANWNNFISIDGAPPAEPRSFFRAVGPGYLETIGVPWRDGRDIRPGEANPSVAVVNQAFARAYYGGRSPLGKVFHLPWRNGTRRAITVVGVVGDARYRDLREPVPPVAYVPFRDTLLGEVPRPRLNAAFLVRATTADVQALTASIRARVAQETPTIAVSSVRTQESVIAAQTVRERLLATLGAFFAVVALLLSAVGLYGVTDYLVVQRRRDIGICLALGAPTGRIARLVAGGVTTMVALGGVLGLVVGMGSERYLGALLFGVTTSDVTAVAWPAAIVMLVTAVACATPILRALRTDITATIRAQ
jgi:predicted permease